MNLKLTIVFFTIFLLIGNLKSQSNSYNLSDYKLPDFIFKSLDLNAEFKQRNSFSNISNSTNIPSNSNFYYSGFGSLNYNSIQNDIVWQKNTSIYGSLALFYDDQPNGSNQRDFSVRTTVNFIQQNRKYIKEDFFREINYDFSSSFNLAFYPYNNNLNLNRSNTFSLDQTIILPIKFGKGRIEQVTDARQAIFILERLKKEGILKREASKEDVRAFAEMISKLNFRRYFDFRLRRIYELEKIDSFLQNNDFISKTDVKYFAHLNDMWNYGRDQIRFSGNRFSLAFYPGYTNYILRSRFPNSNFNINLFSSTGGLEYSSQKPINLYWQNEIEVHSYLGGIIGKQKFTNGNEASEFILIPKLSIGASETLYWYPNTRTSIAYRFGIESHFVGNNLDKNFDLKDLRVQLFQLSPYSNLNFNYFLNPRLQMTIDFSIDYNLIKGNGFSNINDASTFGRNIRSLLYYPIECPNFACLLDGNNSKSFANQLTIKLNYNIF